MIENLACVFCITVIICWEFDFDEVSGEFDEFCSFAF